MVSAIEWPKEWDEVVTAKKEESRKRRNVSDMPLKSDSISGATKWRLRLD